VSNFTIVFNTIVMGTNIILFVNENIITFNN